MTSVRWPGRTGKTCGHYAWELVATNHRDLIRDFSEPGNWRGYCRRAYRDALVCLDGVETIREWCNQMGHANYICVLQIAGDFLVRPRTENQHVALCAELFPRDRGQRIWPDEQNGGVGRRASNLDNKIGVEARFMQRTHVHGDRPGGEVARTGSRALKVLGVHGVMYHDDLASRTARRSQRGGADDDRLSVGDRNLVERGQARYLAGRDGRQ